MSAQAEADRITAIELLSQSIEESRQITRLLVGETDIGHRRPGIDPWRIEQPLA